MTLVEKRKPSKNISAFLNKTYQILQNQENSHAIRWAKNGVGFVVLSQQIFSKYILPKYFKHSNYSSFVRQLNMYNFHKMREGSSDSYFYHEFFQEREFESIGLIKRKPEKKKRKNQGWSDDGKDDVSINEQKRRTNSRFSCPNGRNSGESQKKVSVENTMHAVGSEEDGPRNRTCKNILSMQIVDDQLSINQQITERCPRFNTRQLIYTSNHLLPYDCNGPQVSNFCLLP